MLRWILSASLHTTVKFLHSGISQSGRASDECASPLLSILCSAPRWQSPPPPASSISSMDTNQYQQHAYAYGQSNGHNTNSPAAQQQQQQSSAPGQAPTLPPLQQQAGQNQNGGYSFGNLSYGQPGSQSSTPTTPHNPSMPGAQQQPHPYPQHMSPTATTGSMAPPSGYANPYNPALLYPSSSASAMPATTSALLPNIRPMPPGGMMQGNLPSLAQAGQQLGQMGQAPSFMQDEQQPTHVVGSQGRRGILPSAPGRPNPPAQGTGTAAKSMIPQKDADGKYPCPHCNKTYLHAKHLKRHLLRRMYLISCVHNKI